jgi:hypothetical protein
MDSISVPTDWIKNRVMMANATAIDRDFFISFLHLQEQGVLCVDCAIIAQKSKL